MAVSIPPPPVFSLLRSEELSAVLDLDPFSFSDLFSLSENSDVNVVFRSSST